SYSISGGSVGSYDGKRTGRLKHLEKLASEIQMHQSEVEKTKTELQETENHLGLAKNNLSETQKAIYQLDNELSKAVLTVNTQTSKKDFITSNCESNERNLQKLQDELVQINEQKNNAPGLGNLSLEEMKINLQKLTEQQREKQDVSNKAQKISQDASNIYNQKNISFLQQQNRIQNIIRETGYKTTQQANLNTSIENLQKESEAISEQIEETAQIGNTSETGLKQHVEEKVALEHQLTESEKSYFDSKGQIDQLEKQITETRRKKEVADELMHTLHNEASDVNLKVASLKERLSVEFSIEVDDVVNQEQNPEWNEEDLKT